VARRLCARRRDHGGISFAPEIKHELSICQQEPSGLQERISSRYDSRSGMIPATQYFSQDYSSDFELLGGESMCGFNLLDMMAQPKRSKFRGFPEFALCQFALNLHNQAFYTHFPRLHCSWRGYVAPFGNTLLCFSGHGLGSHAPDSILRFVQAPIDRDLPPVHYNWSEVFDYMQYFFGDYLSAFAATIQSSEFTRTNYLRLIASDLDCRASLLVEGRWESRHIADLLNMNSNG